MVKIKRYKIFIAVLQGEANCPPQGVGHATLPFTALTLKPLLSFYISTLNFCIGHKSGGAESSKIYIIPRDTWLGMDDVSLAVLFSSLQQKVVVLSHT